MSNDFSRNAHVSSRELGSRTHILHALHIDPWLMLPLIALSVSGLFVLYSASGQSDTMLMTQIRNLGVAFFVLAHSVAGTL